MAVHHLQSSWVPREYSCFGQLGFGAHQLKKMKEDVPRAGATELFETLL